MDEKEKDYVKIINEYAILVFVWRLLRENTDVRKFLGLEDNSNGT